jgi:hypothetical protein
MQAIHEMHKILGQVDILVSSKNLAHGVPAETRLTSCWLHMSMLQHRLDCLQGSPIVLANSLLAGGRAFLAEPAKARTPKDFARGVASGGHGLPFARVFLSSLGI